MLPVFFEIGPVPVRAYGTLVLVGFLLALAYAMRRARRRAARHSPGETGVITPEHVFDMAVVGLFLCIVGARLLYVLLNPGQFRESPLDIVRTWKGGLSIHGSLAVGLIWLAVFCRRHRLRFLDFGDLCAPAFALGYSIGRIGCFLNGCCYGYACDLPWAFRFYRDGDYNHLTPPCHPTQLYAAAFNLLFFGLLHLWSVRRHRRGDILMGYLALYSIYRFVDEAFRRDASAVVLVGGLTYAQVFSALSLPAILCLWAMVRRRSGAVPDEREPAAPVDDGAHV